MRQPKRISCVGVVGLLVWLMPVTSSAGACTVSRVVVAAENRKPQFLAGKFGAEASAVVAAGSLSFVG